MIKKKQPEIWLLSEILIAVFKMFKLLSKYVKIIEVLCNKREHDTHLDLHRALYDRADRSVSVLSLRHTTYYRVYTSLCPVYVYTMCM